jgi:hypothetical protein
MNFHPRHLSLSLVLLATVVGFTAPVVAQSSSADNLARRSIERRATEAVIWGMPIVNYDLMVQELLTKTKGKVNQIVFWSRPLDWRNQTLTPNPDSIYFMAFYNTKDGPIVIEIPPRRLVQRQHRRRVADADRRWGTVRRRQRQRGQVPAAAARLYRGNSAIPLRSETFGGMALLRSNLVSHSEPDVAKSVAYGKRAKVYPLSQAANPPPTTFIDAADAFFDSTIRYDLSFFTNLDRMVQSEPWLQRDRVMIDMLKTIGIEKGKPFKPDAQTREALTAGVREAQALLMAKYEKFFPPFEPYWPGSHWAAVVTPELVQAWRTSLGDVNSYPLDARALTYTYAYISLKNLGAGQFYLLTNQDSAGKALDGSKTYRLNVPPNVPVEQYWSATAYDGVLHTLIRNVSRASRSSQIPEMKKNADGSIDVYFGPKAPAGEDANWVPTDPQKEFEVILRLYGPTKALFDKTWKLSDIEEVK